MEKEPKNRIEEDFSESEALNGKRIHVLHIEDIYKSMETALIDELETKLSEFLET